MHMPPRAAGLRELVPAPHTRSIMSTIITMHHLPPTGVARRVPAACRHTRTLSRLPPPLLPLFSGYALFPRDACDIATVLSGTYPTYPNFTAATAIWANGKNVPSRNGGARALKGESHACVGSAAVRERAGMPDLGCPMRQAVL